ncbi:gamma-parvin [Panthera uncia]|uniref:gamma-parvin n=1 Tax=Panthera uncia TaxID=29064 RepID=UPI0020FFC9DF|nr:gamma-parvin [Panthera uncia]
MAARAGKAEMEPESLYNLLQLPKAVGRPAEEELPQGEKKKYLPPTSRGDPKFEELQKVLMDWINARLLPEHIVVRSLEEDIFDGLILHHLFQTLTGLRLDVEEMALTVPNQRRKLEAVLEAVNRSLQAEDQPLKWSMDAIFNKDLLATLHLLVALAKRFQPDLPLPTNVQVEVITMESTKSGLKSEKSVEQLTECSTDKDPATSEYFSHRVCVKTDGRMKGHLLGVLCSCLCPPLLVSRAFFCSICPFFSPSVRPRIGLFPLTILLERQGEVYSSRRWSW